MPVYPPHHPVPASTARAADLAATRAGVPSLALMEHAARGLAALAAELRRGPGPVAVVCGPGNNGGDGYGCARFLDSWGIPARILRFSGDAPRTDDARAEAALVGPGVAFVEVPRAAPEALGDALFGASLVVDALFGIGLVRALEPPYPAALAALNDADAPRLAVDLPSGLHADDGRPLPVAVRADVTAAMGLPKLGCTTATGRAYAGRVVEIDIGLPRAVHAPFLRTEEQRPTGRPHPA